MLNTIRDEENDNLKISIIIPCYNEEKHIGKCLDSLIDNNYPKDLMEIFVIDGMSEDSTREIVKKYAKQFFFIKLIDNPKKITPIAMNIGIKGAKGDIITFLGAHSTYNFNYIEKLVLWSRKSRADNVGGISITKPSTKTIIANAISLVLSHPFGVGNSYFRIGIKEPIYADTVSLGCYRKEVFDKIGLFNEKLIRNQDIEFNLRLKKAGGEILLVPDIISYYYARSNLKGLFKQNFWNGFWVLYSTKFTKTPFSLRHLVPFFFVLSFCGSLFLSLFYRSFIQMFFLVLVAYFISNIFFSLGISFKKGFKYFIPVILSFATLHFSYGFGSIWGLIKLMGESLKKLV